MSDKFVKGEVVEGWFGRKAYQEWKARVESLGMVETMHRETKNKIHATWRLPKAAPEQQEKSKRQRKAEMVLEGPGS